MGTKHTAGAHHDLTTEASETARETVAHSGGGLLTMIVSALALIFSGVSLYQTVLKQALLGVHLADAISYTRDPDGNYEVFVLPITITNAGARDGIVSSLQLTARNIETGLERSFDASYFTREGYFSTKTDASKNIKRPKAPFAPLGITGRGAYTGTVLFYPRKYSKQKVVTGKGSFELRITARTAPSDDFGFLDKLRQTTITPITTSYTLARVSRYFEGRMLIGHTVRLFGKARATTDQN